MNSGLPYPALTRLLSLNNRVHDLENQLRRVTLPFPVEVVGEQARADGITTSSIAQMQEEIDQGVRASLITCWLSIETDLED